jgi:hypothetical protein
MQAEQRRKIDEDRFDPQETLWHPFTVHGEDGTDHRPLDVDAGDSYVVVEEIEDGRVVFEVSAWPRLDKDGRLVFAGDPTEFYAGLEASQTSIDQARLEAGVTGPERPLRTGDVFAVRGLPAKPEDIATADAIWDVSLAGRNAAKAALYGAAASTVEEEYAREMVISAEYGEEVEAELEPGQFDVRQQSVIGKYATLPPIEGGKER